MHREKKSVASKRQARVAAGSTRQVRLRAAPARSGPPAAAHAGVNPVVLAFAEGLSSSSTGVYRRDTLESQEIG